MCVWKGLEFVKRLYDVRLCDDDDDKYTLQESAKFIFTVKTKRGKESWLMTKFMRLPHMLTFKQELTYC